LHAPSSGHLPLLRRLVRTRRGRRGSGAETFLLAGDAVGRALPVTCAAATLACSIRRGGMKRARAAAEVFPASAPPLGFGAFGGAPTAAAAAAVGEIE
jgi:hypothetical protein